MQTIEATRQDWQPTPGPLTRHEYPTVPADGALIVAGDARITDAETGALVALVVTLGAERHLGIGGLIDRLAVMTYDGTVANANEFRLSGFNNAHRTFGYSAPVPLRRRWGCSSCGFNREEPDVAERTERIARHLWTVFETGAPEEAEAHRSLVDDAIHPDWHWGGAPWTSGIINRTAALPYHRDAGNLKGAWSAQLTLRKNVDGGFLHFPEYGLYLAVPSRSALLFSGQSTWHGVTPLKPTAPRSYRYSMVLYAKAGCRDCGPAADEHRRAAKNRTVRESEPA